MHKPIIVFCFIIGVFASCSREKQVSQNLQAHIYFDIKGFFENEADRLSRATMPVLKEIERNGGAKESKTILIKNWEKEFGLFMESDINKPAWTASYEVIEEGNTLTYNSLDPELRTQKIVINKNGDDEVKTITIHNKVSNKLYTSEEQLFYSPDSLYKIDKEQDIRVIGTNRYLVVGKFR